MPTSRSGGCVAGPLRNGLRRRRSNEAHHMADQTDEQFRALEAKVEGVLKPVLQGR
jgi:hypothetical protein